MGYTSKYAQDSLAKNGNSDDKLKKAGDKLASKLKKSDDDKKKKKVVEKSKDKRFTGKAGDKSSVKTRGGGERIVTVGGVGVRGKF
jgi:hypothetical protein